MTNEFDQEDDEMEKRRREDEEKRKADAQIEEAEKWQRVSDKKRKELRGLLHEEEKNRRAVEEKRRELEVLLQNVQVKQEWLEEERRDEGVIKDPPEGEKNDEIVSLQGSSASKHALMIEVTEMKAKMNEMLRKIELQDSNQFSFQEHPGESAFSGSEKRRRRAGEKETRRRNESNSSECQSDSLFIPGGVRKSKGVGGGRIEGVPHGLEKAYSSQSERAGSSQSESMLGSAAGLLVEKQASAMLSMAMPPVGMFDGKGGLKKFDAFLSRLEMKYRPIASDQQMTQLLKNHLEREAETIFNSFARKRVATYEEMKVKMRERLKGDQTMQEYEAMRDWEEMSKRSSESVSSFCMRVEEMADRAFPEMPEKHLAPIMAKKLLKQLGEWTHYRELIEVMERADKREKYEKVKEHASRMEIVEQRGAKLAAGASSRNPYTVNVREGHREPEKSRGPRLFGPRFGHKQQTSHQGQSGQRTGGEFNPGARPFVPSASESRPQPTQDVRNITSIPRENGNALGSTRPPVKCYSCGGRGHMAWQCTTNPSRTTSNVMREVEDVPRKESARENEQVREVDEEEGVFWRPLKKTEVTINGVVIPDAVLDTGAEITTIPQGVMKRVEEAGTQIEWRETKEELLDAAASKLRVVGKALVQLKMNGNEKKVGVYVVENGWQVLLGQNTIELWDGCWTEREEKGEPAVVVERVYIGPLAQKDVMLEAPTDGTRSFLSSELHGLSGLVMQRTAGRRRVQVMNLQQTPLILNKGEKVGEWRKADFVLIESEVETEKKQQREKVSSERAEVVLQLVEKQGAIENEECRRVVKQNAEVFAVTEEEMGRTSMVKHVIDTGEARPIKQKGRPVPLGVQTKVREMLSDMKRRGVIRDSNSPWASPLVIAQKKDGTLRLCVDYRKLNSVVREDAYPLPRIDLTIQKLSGKKWFTTLDLMAGYWQVEMEEGSKEKTAFCTMGGLYEFNVLPFGLSTSPATFQRLMERILADLLGDQVAVYIDDILIATETQEEHAQMLEKVLEAFRKHGLKLKAQKCRVAQAEVEYLGHMVTREGVKMDAAKVQKIIELQAPREVKELKRFLGMASFYRKFVFKFSEKASVLTRLTSEKVEWKWGEQEQRAFEELKEMLISAPILAQPDVNAALKGERPFVIYCDASQVAVGAVLTQEGEDGCFHPLYFASKRCTPAERKYHVTDSEALAVMYALRKFKPIYFGTRVVVRTDHMPLKALFSERTTSARIMRWALELQSCDVTIEYVKGKANKVADALSRGELVPGAETSESAQEEKAEIERVVNSLSLGGTRERWREKLKDDAFAGEMKGKLEGVMEKMVREKGFRWSEENGLLMVEGARGGRKFYVPEELRAEVLEQFHDGKLGGHWGVSKTKKKLKEYFWPSMNQDIREYIEKCRECTLFNVREEMVPPLKPMVVGEPFETVAIDVMEVGTSLSGNRYVLTVIDCFSKLGAAFAMQTKGAKEVAEKFCWGWIAEGRLPQNLVSDRGGEFVNRVLSHILEILEVKHILTKGYVPRENGMCERLNGTLIRLLQKKVKEKEKWDEMLPFCVYAYNTKPHSTTGMSPYFLVYGREPRPLGERLAEVGKKPVEVEDYARELVEGMRMAREEAAERARKEIGKMKSNYDRKNRVEEKEYPRKGERVLVRVPVGRGDTVPKLTPEWSGPFRVIDVTENSARVKKEGSKEELIIPFDQLRKVAEECQIGELNKKRMQRRINCLAGESKNSEENEELLQELVRWTTSDDNGTSSGPTTKGRPSSDSISSDLVAANSSDLMATSDFIPNSNNSTPSSPGSSKQNLSPLISSQRHSSVAVEDARIDRRGMSR